MLLSWRDDPEIMSGRGKRVQKHTSDAKFNFNLFIFLYKQQHTRDSTVEVVSSFKYLL